MASQQMGSIVVLITGANSGVGFAAAKVIADASESFQVIMTGRSLEKVKSGMSEIETAGVKGSLSTLQLDVTDNKSIKQAAKLVQEKYGRLDVLINNAAVGSNDPDIKTRLRLSMETNVIGPAVVAEVFRPLLLKSEKPYSIYVSSGAGSLTRAAEPTSPTYKNISYEEAYRASKAALNMIAIQEAKVFGPKGLYVFTMCPGFVVSNLRGTSEEARTGWGGAGDPQISGKTLLSIIQGSGTRMLANSFIKMVSILGKDGYWKAAIKFCDKLMEDFVL